MIKSLQSLRFVFALMIFFHHYSFNGVALFDAGGTCGVSFFIILSGFVMSIGYKQRVLSPSFSYKEYLKRRFARLYPLHLLCLLCVIVCHGINYTLKDWLALIPSLFLLQSWIPIKGVYFAGNAVSWCLSDLFFFYAVFPFVIQSIAKCSVRTNTLILLTVISLYAFAVVVLPETLYHPMLYISPIFRIIDFIIGVYLYEVFSRIITGEFVSKLNRLSFTFKTAIEAFVCLLLVIAILGYHYSPKCIVYASYYWLIMPFVIITLSLFNISGGGCLPVFTNKSYDLSW